VNEAPGLGLSEAAELLQGELKVDLVSIFGFCGDPDARPDAAVLLAAYGAGALQQERAPVTVDPAWSAALQLRAEARDSISARILPEVGARGHASSSGRCLQGRAQGRRGAARQTPSRLPVARPWSLLGCRPRCAAAAAPGGVPVGAGN
jgi:hypothetical protein